MDSIHQAKETASMAGLAGSVRSGKMLKVDEAQVRSHVGEVVRQSVEETLNGRLEAEADQLCGANGTDVHAVS